jgi:iron complex outermembrane receptor protein
MNIGSEIVLAQGRRLPANPHEIRTFAGPEQPARGRREPATRRRGRDSLAEIVFASNDNRITNARPADIGGYQKAPIAPRNVLINLPIDSGVPMFKKTKISRGLLLAFGGSVALSALPALAQEAAKLDRVEITGSAIKRIDAETAVPVTVVKIEDLKKQGITTIEQVVATLSAAQIQQGTSQVVGAGTAGAAFANLRGLGANKTLVLLNGRRIANNAYDSSAPDLNMIPFAGLERVEVLRDGASSLYGTDAIGGVINFITRKDYTGGTITLGADSPQHPGGKAWQANAGGGYGDLATDNFNVFGFVNYAKTDAITGTQRPFNTRYAGGLSPTTYPANYYQADASGNPAGPDCNSPFLIKASVPPGCQITTSSFVNYTPEVERSSGLLRGTLNLNADNQLSLEYFAAKSHVTSGIAPQPNGGLYQNRVLANGTLNPYYPGNPGSSVATPNIPLDPNYAEPDPGNPEGSAGPSSGLNPGFIHVKWRNLLTGQRQDIDTNTQQRFVAALQGSVVGWDYQAALTWNQNKIQQDIAGYSDGSKIGAGMKNGILNPFGDQSAEGTALVNSAVTNGNVQNAKGTVGGADARIGRELGDWFGAGRPSALALGLEYQHQNFVQQANFDVAQAVVASYGLDPNTYNAGTRNVWAGYAELAIPIIKSLDVTASVRYDNYSDFGSTTNPKISFRFQPVQEVLVRGSYSTGFRAPSLYDINSAPYYTNTSQQNDPVNCPGGTPIAGKPAAANCQQQFQALYGGNTSLQPEKSKNATLGFAFQPTANLNFGFDFWWIKLTNQIGSLAANTVFGDATTFAGNYHRTPSGNLSTDGSQCSPFNPLTCGYVDLRTQNLGGLNTNGLDISAAYRLLAGDAGNFTFGLQSTYVFKYNYQDYTNGPWNQNVGVFVGTGPIFRWKSNFTVNWAQGPWGVGFASYYATGYTDQDPTYHVASYWTADLFGSWAATKNLSFILGIRNLTDRDPPLSYQTQVFQAGYDPRFTDPTGRTYYVRGTYAF